MIVNTALKTVAPFVPVASSAYGFAKTCFKVYNATSPTKALVAGVKGIIIDYPPYSANKTPSWSLNDPLGGHLNLSTPQ